MNIQIIGTKKNKDTRAAERFFKERRVPYQFVDLSERALSSGELHNITRTVNAEELIDPESKEYKKRGLAYMEYDVLEEIMENPLLLKQPIVRCGKDAGVGYAPDMWQEWIKQNS